MLSAARSDGNEKRAGLAQRLDPLGMPLQRIMRSMIREGRGGEASLRSLQIGCTSHGTSNFGQWDRSIRKNIIGQRMCPGTWHGTGSRMAIRGKQAFAQGVFRDTGRPFAMLDQPAREQGTGVLFEPLVVGKTREFIALKRVA